MMDFDITEFSNLPESKKSFLRSIINQTQSKEDIRSTAKRCFEVIAPKKDKNVLLSSLKDFGRLNYSEEEVLAGIHVFRSFFAHQIHKVRKASCDNSYSIDIGELSNQFDREGIVSVENFLDQNLRDRVEEEMQLIGYSVEKRPNNIIANMSPESFPALHDVLKRSDMKEIVFGLLGYPTNEPEPNVFYNDNTFVQKLNIKPNDRDVQKVLHSDTFFPCIKWWYFPHEVGLHGGPFSYVPESNQFSPRIAKFLYEQSIAIVRKDIPISRTYGHAEGSFRIFDDEMKYMGLEEIPYAVPANTLVLANVCGFHRRSEVKDEVKRFSIHGSIRVLYPFN